jgi:hypothetical protein
MAKQKEAPDAQHVAVVLTADLAQISADSKTHPDSDARERIAKAVSRIYSIVEGTVTPDLRAKILRAAELMQ